VAQPQVVFLDGCGERAVLGDRDRRQPADPAVGVERYRKARPPRPDMVRPRVVRARVDQAGEAGMQVG